MKWRSAFLIILILFAVTQILGVMFQYTLFEIERQENPTLVKQESESLSPYRGTGIPLVVLPIAFLIVLNLYLFLFRFNLAIKIFKIFIYVAAIFCFAVIMQVIGAFFLTLVVDVGLYLNVIQNANLIVSIVAPTLLLIVGKYRIIINNVLGICLCAIVGSVLASYFTIKTIIVLLGVISIFDYYFVMRSKKIPTLVEILEKYDMPIALDISYPRERNLKEPKETVETRESGYQLGFGDLVFATGLSVAFYIDSNAIAAMTTTITTTLALAMFILLVKKEGTKPYPAIPAIFIGGLISIIFIYCVLP
jgi:presenilin-like A22 family membrane protease